MAKIKGSIGQKLAKLEKKSGSPCPEYPNPKEDFKNEKLNQKAIKPYDINAIVYAVLNFLPLSDKTVSEIKIIIEIKTIETKPIQLISPTKPIKAAAKKFAASEGFLNARRSANPASGIIAKETVWGPSPYIPRIIKRQGIKL